ncbi:TPA: flavin reductase [Pseudomonas aeruginosa]|nr:flavin reductase [Pseudomonas aeruginosa]
MTPEVTITQFREAMSLLGAAVNVITSDGPAGRVGFTASAVCSVTDQPPTMLVCVNRSSFSHSCLVKNGTLCINVLMAQQEETSALFANRELSSDDRFARTPWRVLSTGAPALDGALVNLDGIIADMYDVGTHSIFIVKIKQICISSEPQQGGLVYFNRSYQALPRQRNEMACHQ